MFFSLYFILFIRRAKTEMWFFFVLFSFLIFIHIKIRKTIYQTQCEYVYEFVWDARNEYEVPSTENGSSISIFHIIFICKLKLNEDLALLISWFTKFSSIFVRLHNSEKWHRNRICVARCLCWRSEIMMNFWFMRENISNFFKWRPHDNFAVEMRYSSPVTSYMTYNFVWYNDLIQWMIWFRFKPSK